MNAVSEITAEIIEDKFLKCLDEAGEQGITVDVIDATRGACAALDISNSNPGVENRVFTLMNGVARRRAGIVVMKAGVAYVEGARGKRQKTNRTVTYRLIG